MKLAIYGAGGLGRVVAESILRTGAHDLAGFIDDSPTPPAGVPGGSILGGSDDLADLAASGAIEGVVVAIGANAVRAKLAAKAQAAGLALPAIVDATAVLSPSANVGEGAVIAAAAVIGPAATIGRLAIVNAAAVVEHDATVGEAAYVGPRALIDARARIAEGAWIDGGRVVGKDEAVGCDDTQE